MTKHEKSCPESIDGSRIRRIAAGSGTLRRNVCELLDWLVDLERDL
jgi:signal recognition particle GTPase